MTPAEFKATRESLGLTSDDLARLLDVSTPTITRMEAGVMNVPDRRAEQLRQIADRFDSDVERLSRSSDKTLTVPRNDSERTDTTTPARWQRQAALRAARRTGKHLTYIKESSDE